MGYCVDLLISKGKERHYKDERSSHPTISRTASNVQILLKWQKINTNSLENNRILDMKRYAMEPILTKDIKKKSVCVSKILSSKHK
jgi:hypothetical protein